MTLFVISPSRLLFLKGFPLRLMILILMMLILDADGNFVDNQVSPFQGFLAVCVFVLYLYLNLYLYLYLYLNLYTYQAIILIIKPHPSRDGLRGQE